MDLAELLLELRRRNIRLEAVGGEIVAYVPKGAMTPELQEAIHLCKESLQVLLVPESLRKEILEMAKRAGWPELRIKPWITVHPGEDAWARFVHAVSARDMEAAKVVLVDLLQEA